MAIDIDDPDTWPATAAECHAHLVAGLRAFKQERKQLPRGALGAGIGWPRAFIAACGLDAAGIEALEREHGVQARKTWYDDQLVFWLLPVATKH